MKIYSISHFQLNYTIEILTNPFRESKSRGCGNMTKEENMVGGKIHLIQVGERGVWLCWCLVGCFVYLFTFFFYLFLICLFIYLLYCP